MTDKETELIVKRSRNFALLCAVILILVTAVFLVNYIGFGKEEGSTTCDVENKTNFICGNAIDNKGNSNSKGAKLFKQNCAVCHSANTDQRYTGPGLIGITDRLPKPTEKWFTAWVLNSEKVLRSGDPYAKKIHKENGNAAMTVFEGQLSKEDVHEIYNFLTSSIH